LYVLKGDTPSNFGKGESSYPEKGKSEGLGRSIILVKGFCALRGKKGGKPCGKKKVQKEWGKGKLPTEKKL